MKKEMRKAFQELYPEHRILAVQLNGFSHKVYFDAGSKDTPVQVEYYSPHLSTYERGKLDTNRAKALLEVYPTYEYQGNAKEIVFLNPEER